MRKKTPQRGVDWRTHLSWAGSRAFRWCHPPSNSAACNTSVPSHPRFAWCVSKSCPILADLAGSRHRVNRTKDLWIFVNGKDMVRKGLTKPEVKNACYGTHAPTPGPVRLSAAQPSGLREPYLVWSSQKAWNLSTFRDTVLRVRFGENDDHSLKGMAGLFSPRNLGDVGLWGPSYLSFPQRGKWAIEISKQPGDQAETTPNQSPRKKRPRKNRAWLSGLCLRLCAHGSVAFVCVCVVLLPGPTGPTPLAFRSFSRYCCSFSFRQQPPTAISLYALPGSRWQS